MTLDLPNKIMDTSRAFLARQPIFRANMNVFGYELLFRSGLQNFCSAAIDSMTATSQVMSNSQYLLGLQQVTGGKRAFINFPQGMLNRHTSFLFSARNTVVEILEDVKVTPSLLKNCARLVEKGYVFALDDFRYRPELEPLMEMAKIVKFDVLAMSWQELEEEVARARKFNLKLLAEKVETMAQFERLKEMGFHLYQGYFFSRPEILSSKDIPGSKLRYLNMLGQLQDPTTDYDKMAELISHDVSLAYKLLRYVNSAAFAVRVEVKSLQSAIALVGEETLRQWISMMMLSYLADDKPHELLSLSVQRARFCQGLSVLLPGIGTRATCYTLGMLSLLDVILERDMGQILDGLHLDPDLCEALLSGTGRLAPVLALTKAYEQGAWHLVMQLCQTLSVNSLDLPPLLAVSVEAASHIYFGN
ncbi:MAG: HDOD domain-containing protein [Desulfurivibrionaceae bacterium]|nr:HDOD domain-containing protein [Desulfurivibrionaceae bacterium]